MGGKGLGFRVSGLQGQVLSLLLVPWFEPGPGWSVGRLVGWLVGWLVG